MHFYFKLGERRFLFNVRGYTRFLGSHTSKTFPDCSFLRLPVPSTCRRVNIKLTILALCRFPPPVMFSWSPAAYPQASGKPSRYEPAFPRTSSLPLPCVQASIDLAVRGRAWNWYYWMSDIKYCVYFSDSSISSYNFQRMLQLFIQQSDRKLTAKCNHRVAPKI